MRLAQDHSKCVIIRDNRWGSRSVRCAHLACRRDKTRGCSAPMVLPASIPESYIDGRASSCRDNRGNQEVSDALTSPAVVINRGNDSHRRSYQHLREATSAAGPVPVISDNRGNRDDGPCSVPELECAVRPLTVPQHGIPTLGLPGDRALHALRTRQARS